MQGNNETEIAHNSTTVGFFFSPLGFFLSQPYICMRFKKQSWDYMEYIILSFLSCFYPEQRGVGLCISVGVFLVSKASNMLFCQIIHWRVRYTIFLPLGHLGFFKDFLYLFLERGREGERKRDKHRCMREKHPLGCLSPPPQLGARPTTQACVLTRSQTSNVLVCGMTPNPLSHTSQGRTLRFLNITCPKQ